MASKFVFCCCCNTLPQIWGLKTTPTHYLMVMEVRIPEGLRWVLWSKSHQDAGRPELFWKLWRRFHNPDHSGCWMSPTSLLTVSQGSFSTSRGSPLSLAHAPSFKPSNSDPSTSNVSNQSHFCCSSLPFLPYSGLRAHMIMLDLSRKSRNLPILMANG